MEAKELIRCPVCDRWTKATETYCWSCKKRIAAYQLAEPIPEPAAVDLDDIKDDEPGIWFLAESFNLTYEEAAKIRALIS